MRKTLGWFSLTIAALGATATLRAQEQPLGIRGTFSTGYYSTSTRGAVNQDLTFVPVGARFDIDGFLVNPDLLYFSLQPELNVGPQASEAGFQGGNGIRLRTTLFRRLAPLTFRYSNVQVEDVFFGSLSQVSGYTLKDRNKDMGVTLELKPSKLPSLIVDWGKSSVDSKAGIAQIPDYLSRGDHVNADSQYERWGWITEGFFHYQKENSDLLEPIDGGTTNGTLLQKVMQYQGSARRGFFGDSEFSADGGSQSTSTLLFSLPIDLNTRYANANLRLFQKRRWRTSLRAGYSSNLASQLLAQAAASLVGGNSVAQAPDILVPFAHGMSTYNLNGITNLDVTRGLGLYASVERSAVLSDSQEGSLNANYFTTAAGLTYVHKFQWGSASGEYGREFGRGSVTGQTGTIQGQVYRVGVQHGNSTGLQFDGMVHGTDQSVRNAQPLSNKSVSVEGSVSDRVYRDFTARLGGGWQWGSVVNSANDFRTNGYIARAGIEHPRLQLSGSLNNTLSNSLPFYSQALTDLGIGAVVVSALRPIPSDYRGMSATIHAIPFRKVEVSATWNRSRQHLDGILSNDFQLLDVYATYHFRRIQLEAGFIRSNQVFAAYPETLRQRLYIRIVRSARLL